MWHTAAGNGVGKYIQVTESKSDCSHACVHLFREQVWSSHWKLQLQRRSEAASEGRSLSARCESDAYVFVSCGHVMLAYGDVMLACDYVMPACDHVMPVCNPFSTQDLQAGHCLHNYSLYCIRSLWIPCEASFPLPFSWPHPLLFILSSISFACFLLSPPYLSMSIPSYSSSSPFELDPPLVVQELVGGVYGKAKESLIASISYLR